jgi:transcriptional regulator with XRE-family HTH domain
MAKAGKTGIFEKAPNAQTVKFAGKFINLSAIARAQGLDVSYLSRIFRGERAPSLKHCTKIAAVLGMTLDDFVQGLEERCKAVQAERESLMRAHTDRISREDAEDLRTYAKGSVPAPRLPAVRKVS